MKKSLRFWKYTIVCLQPVKKEKSFLDAVTKQKNTAVHKPASENYGKIYVKVKCKFVANKLLFSQTVTFVCF